MISLNFILDDQENKQKILNKEIIHFDIHLF